MPSQRPINKCQVDANQTKSCGDTESTLPPPTIATKGCSSSLSKASEKNLSSFFNCSPAMRRGCFTPTTLLWLKLQTARESFTYLRKKTKKGNAEIQICFCYVRFTGSAFCAFALAIALAFGFHSAFAFAVVGPFTFAFQIILNFGMTLTPALQWRSSARMWCSMSVAFAVAFKNRTGIGIGIGISIGVGAKFLWCVMYEYECSQARVASEYSSRVLFVAHSECGYVHFC